MRTSLKTLEGLKKSLTVYFPIEMFSQKMDKILQKMATEVTIDGFRKGKVPISILRQKFGENARSDVSNEIVNETLVDALAKVKITPAARPVISKIDLKDGGDFSYTVEFETYPQIQTSDFTKLTIEQIKVAITPKDEEKALKELISESTEYKLIKRKSRIHDQISIDFKGTIDGKEFDGGKADDFKLVLGKGSMIKGFEEGLINMNAGSKTILNLTFPKDYHVVQLAGKAVVFEVSVKAVFEPKVPKLDAKFAQKFGEKDIQSLEQNIQKRMRSEIDSRLANQNKQAVFDALLAAHDFEVPQASIDNEAQNLLKDAQARLQQQNIPVKDNLSVATFNDEAHRRVRLGLLINQIASEHKISASKEQINAKLAEMAQTYGENSQQMIDYYNQDPNRLSTIELLVVEKMVENIILEKAKIVTKNRKFQELL